MFRHTVSLQAAVVLSLAGVAGFSQTISGVITDSRGAAIAGASVDLVARDNIARVSVTSDSSGRYRFERLVPDAYLVEAAAAGFQKSAATQVTLGNEDQQVNFQLGLAAVRTAVVVTASGTAQTTDELAKSVSTVDSNFLSLGDEASLNEALRFTPGLRAEQQGGPGGLVSLKTRGLRNQDTAVLLDGFRLRDAAAPQGDATGLLQDVMIADLDRIEVMRGAGSSLYGTNATGGVVNMITQAGGGRTRGSVLAEGGSLAMFRGLADLAGSFRQDALQYSLGLSHFDVLYGIYG